LHFKHNTVKGDKVIPKSLEAKIGDHAQFMCISAPNSHWKFNDGYLQGNAKITITSNQKHSFLRISHLKLENTGRYSCTWSNESGLYYRDFGTLTVKSNNTR